MQFPPRFVSMNIKKQKKYGKQGGNARAKKLSPARRVEIAKKAARARWGKQKDRP